MLSSKFGLGWVWKLFLPMLVIAIGIIIVVIALPFGQEICVTEQGQEIQKVNDKIEELKGIQGGEVIKFEVKDCVEKLGYTANDPPISIYGILFVGNITVKYKTAERPIQYLTQYTWNLQDLDNKILEKEDYRNYKLEVSSVNMVVEKVG
jgi:hypothetical protein